MLTWFPSHRPLPDEIDAEQALDDAEDYWLEWASTCNHFGDYHDEIHQSLLVLKALTYGPTGGIVAAPTTSLPEWIGGVRNWDYRFCWLRDATLTLRGDAQRRLPRRGDRTGATGCCARSRAIPADVQIMYGIAGERRLDERELDWLPGYEGSRPVRVGNAASAQLQLDVYGEVIDALYQTRAHGAAPDDNIWALPRKLLEWLEDGWRQAGRGHLGGARPAAALHALEGDVVGRVRPRASATTTSSAATGRSSAGGRCATRSTPRCCARAWCEEKQAFAQSYGSRPARRRACC